MRVLIINGSPNERGCTHAALSEVERMLKEADIDTAWVQVKGAVRGCVGCGRCARNHRCVFDTDGVNEALDLLETSHGLLIGSPVYYASPNGALLAFLDRLFYTGGGHRHYKPGAAVVSARRAGTTAALDVLNKYFLLSNMPVVPSQYWNMVHGNTPQEVQRDEEGLQIMRTLGRNMAWMLRCFEKGEAPPAREPERKRTNFIDERLLR